MDPFTRLTAVAAPFDTPDSDTDMIIPQRFLRKPLTVGYRNFLFFNDRFDAVVGASANHQSKTNTELGQFVELRKKAYTLVDLRAGVESHDGDWRLMGWVRNAGDTVYWTSAARSIDVYNRYMGMPRTYGLTLTYRYK